MARAPAMQAGKKRCPRCAETVKSEAHVCRHCGYEFSAEEMSRQQAFEAKQKRTGMIGCGVLVILALGIWQCSERVGSGAHDAPQTTSNSAEPEIKSDPAGDLVYRIQEYWSKELAAISVEKPIDRDDIGSRLSKLDLITQALADAEHVQLTSAQRKEVDAFVADISRKQVKLFPVLRRAYGTVMDGVLFRQDVRVRVFGPSSQTVRYTGRPFALNANIEDTQTGARAILRKLRFQRSEYRWNESIGGTTSYTLDPPSDRTVGVTADNGSFSALEMGGGS